MATILAIHKLASAPDESILDLVLKVSPKTKVRKIASSSPLSLEYLPNTSKIFEEYQLSFLAVYHFYEEFGFGDLLSQSPCYVSARIWFYQTAGHPPS
jgi:hypothetical protein